MTGSPDISLHIGISQIVNPSLWTVVLNFSHRSQAKLKIMFLLGGPKNSLGLFWGLLATILYSTYNLVEKYCNMQIRFKSLYKKQKLVQPGVYTIRNPTGLTLKNLGYV